MKKTMLKATYSERCDVCTTPRKCGTLRWREAKGSNCAGQAAGLDKCDCLNACGDDPWLKDGRAEPCESYTSSEVVVAADQIWAGLTYFERVFNAKTN